MTWDRIGSRHQQPNHLFMVCLAHVPFETFYCQKRVKQICYRWWLCHVLYFDLPFCLSKVKDATSSRDQRLFRLLATVILFREQLKLCGISKAPTVCVCQGDLMGERMTLRKWEEKLKGGKQSRSWEEKSPVILFGWWFPGTTAR